MRSSLSTTSSAIAEGEAPLFRRRHHATVNALWIGIQFQDAALLAIIVPAIVLILAPKTHTAVLALLATIASAASTLVPPVAGGLSDWGQRVNASDRRIETGVALGVDALALIGMAFAGNTTTLAIALGVSALALSTASTIYQALLPEIVPREAWGISSGVRGALTLIGTIAGLLVAALLHATWALYTTAACVALGLVTLVLVPEKLEGIGGGDEDVHTNVRDRHDLIVTLIARAFIVLGMTLLNTYILYFFTDVLHVPNAPLRTGLTATGALGGAIVSSIVAGLLSDRYDRRYIVALAGVPMTIAGIGFALYPTPEALIGYAALFGLGFGAVFSVGWALALDSIPEMGDVGRDLGIWATLSGLPAIAAPAIGAFVISHGTTPREGYRLLFIIASIAFALGSATVLKVRKKNKPA
jgi:MFS family permease